MLVTMYSVIVSSVAAALGAASLCFRSVFEEDLVYISEGLVDLLNN